MAATAGYLFGFLVMAGIPAYVLIRLCVGAKSQQSRWMLAGTAAVWALFVAAMSGSELGLVVGLAIAAAAVYYAPIRS